ncbi:MAG: hypothetical protein HY898_36900 [Deltaproteobacteria bacterium]|nr:hypothetical protein [Deltaproteobacteria bacterium]
MKQELVEMFRDTVDPAAQEVVMTVGEQLIAQGRAEGQAQGRAEGRAESILTVLRARGLEVSDAARTRILACADTTMLEQWLARAVSCASVEELVD